MNADLKDKSQCAILALNALRNVVTYDAGVGRDAVWMHLPVFDPRQQFNFAAISMTGHESGPLGVEKRSESGQMDTAFADREYTESQLSTSSLGVL